MKKSEKKFLLILIAVATIIIAILLIVSNKNKEEENQKREGVQNNIKTEEFVDILPDGTKLNNSTKLSETKIVEGLEISNIQLTEKNNQTVLLATIKNNSAEARGGFPAKVTILDKEEKTIVELEAYINEIKPGEEQQLNISSTLDYANAYDIKIVKK